MHPKSFDWVLINSYKRAVASAFRTKGLGWQNHANPAPNK
jgi:hypothetical protein